MSNNDSLSRQTLDAAPGRVLKFLIGLAASRVARMALLAVGYTQSEHDEAWALVTKLGAFGGTPVVDKAAQDAINELNAWDEPNFPVIKTILERKYPAQAAYVFNGLAPSDVGAEAVSAIATLLGRLDALESGKGRDKKEHKADKAAIARLDDRGYTAAERKRLHGLVKMAQTVAPIAIISTADADAIKQELAGFLNEWTTQAKKVIKRRDVLINLGIGSRQKRAVKPPKGTGTAAPTQPPTEVDPPPAILANPIVPARRTILSE